MKLRGSGAVAAAAACSVIALAACLVGGPAGAWLLALAASALPAALIRLAGGPRGPALGLGLLLFGGLAALLLPRAGAAGPWRWLGLPPSAWVAGLLLGALPLLLVTLAHARWPGSGERG